MSQLIVMALGSFSGNGKGMVVSGGKEVVINIWKSSWIHCCRRLELVDTVCEHAVCKIHLYRQHLLY